MVLRANDADGYKSWLALGIEVCGLISLIILTVAALIVFDVPSYANCSTSIRRLFTFPSIDFSEARQVIGSIFTRLIKLLTIGMLRIDIHYFLLKISFLE